MKETITIFHWKTKEKKDVMFVSIKHLLYSLTKEYQRHYFDFMPPDGVISNNWIVMVFEVNDKGELE